MGEMNRRNVILAAGCLTLVGMLCGCGERIHMTVYNDLSYSIRGEYLFESQDELKEIRIDTEEGYNLAAKDFIEYIGAVKGTAKVGEKEYISYTIIEEGSSKATKVPGLFITLDATQAVVNASALTEVLLAGEEGQIAGEGIGAVLAEQLGRARTELDVYSITYPYMVYAANGDIQSDGKTVSYKPGKIKYGRLYASFTEDPSKENTLQIIGAEPDAWHKEELVLTVTGTGIVTGFVLDGVPQATNQVTVSEEGSHELVAELATGEQEKLTVGVDTTKPITNVKGKTYKKAVTIKFSDAISGIKFATLNGEKIKSGKKVSANGTYKLVVKDKAGNKVTVKFKVKK